MYTDICIPIERRVVRRFFRWSPYNAITTKTRRFPIGFTRFQADIVFVNELPFNEKTFDQVIDMRSGNAIIF